MALQLNTRKTTLLDFALRNDQDLNALYILGTPGGQTLTLELTNVAGEPLDLLPPAAASPKPYHFELVFRPGVLSEDTRANIAVQESGVAMSQVKNADGTVALRLTVAKPKTLAPGEKLTCTLLRVAPDGRLGSRGTRVLLRYANAQVHGAGTVVGGFRETHLNIVTHVGKATIPLHLGVVGAGKVLNNGQPNAPLKLRVSNTSLTDDIRPGTQPPSYFYLSFDIGAEKDEWALGTATLVNAIEVLLNGAAVGVEKLPGKTPEWRIQMPALAHGTYFDITLNNIVTQAPAGLTNVHLRCDNIPGYWDGQLVTQLEKSPLVFLETNASGATNVGIGTAKPAQKLEVAGVIYTNGESTGFVADAGGLSRVGLLKYAGREAGIWRTKAQDFEIGRVDADALPGAPKNWTTDFYVSGAGNVGIGTTTPASTLDVRTADNSAAITVGSTGAGDGAVYLGNSNHGLKRGYSQGNDVGLYTTSGNLYLASSGPSTTQFVLTNGGNVGIGNGTPDTKLHVDGAVKITGRNFLEFGGGVAGKEGNAGKIGYGTFDDGASLNIVGAGTTGLNRKIQFWNEGGAYFNGNVGIGLTNPVIRLDVLNTIGVRNGAAWDHLYLNHDGNTAFLTAGGADTGLAFRVGAGAGGSYGDPGQNYRDVMRLMPSGNVGIGTSAPNYPLEVQRTITTNYSNYGYLNGNGSTGRTGNNSGNVGVSIRASGRIMADEFNAFSDARLKAVVGRSDSAADLALLRRLRITDYTMRDQAQYGDQAYKKIIGQELEEVFPQAVHQHTGFLPDIYAPASRVQRQGEALLIGLPAGLPQAAPAGQRLRLMGPAGEVLATLAEAAAAGSQQLLVSGAKSLADAPAQEVFVFGLEHPDVRTVDYEALAMLNVSATQALAQQVQELQELRQALPELHRRLESQDAKVAQYEQLVPALAEALKEQQQQLAELRAQVQQLSTTY